MLSRVLSAIVLLALLPVTAIAQVNLESGGEVFRGEVPQGAWLRIRTLKGNIDVREGSGRTAVVKVGRGRGDGSGRDVTFEVKRDGSSITVCAIYPQTTRCDAENYDSEWRRNDGRYPAVNFTVELPKGVKINASTGNGDVDTRGASEEVRASSGNGEITVDGSGGRVSASTGNGDVEVRAARGSVDASSGNGDITVETSSGPVSASSGNGRLAIRMDRLTGAGDMEFSTGNGSIEVSLPADASADIVADVSQRRFETEFPMQLPGRFGGGRIEGKIGGGGRRIRMSTGNGSVTIRKNG